MSVARDGGPAFPLRAHDAFGDQHATQFGMSLRDWFAGQFVAPLMEIRAFWGVRRIMWPVIAAESYELADAMLAFRLRDDMAPSAVNDLVDTADELLQAALRMECHICGRQIGRLLPDPQNPCPACDAMRLAVARAEGRDPS